MSIPSSIISNPSQNMYLGVKCIGINDNREPSSQLKNFLKDGLIGSKGLKTKQEFIAMRKGWQDYSMAISNEAKARDIEKVEEKFIGKVRTLVITPKSFNESLSDKIIYYIHGGAFTLGSPDHLFPIFASISNQTKLKVYAIDYSLAPEHPFPKGLDDCEEVFKKICEEGILPENIALLGDSAGGNLCLALANRLKQKPACIALFSPMVKGTSTDSYTRNKDPHITYEASVYPSLHAYVDGDMDKLSDPEIDVLQSKELFSLPPVFTQTGSRDALFDDSFSLKTKLDSLNKEIVFFNVLHACHGIVQEFDMPEADLARAKASDFIISKLKI